MSQENQIIIVYGTNWCYDSRRARKIFDENKIPYTWINIDEDPDGRKYVESVNHGNRSVPTIVFPDGSILVEPSNSELMSRLGLS